jgi:hypothetical protein
MAQCQIFPKQSNRKKQNMRMLTVNGNQQMPMRLQPLLLLLSPSLNMLSGCESQRESAAIYPVGGV